LKGTIVGVPSPGSANHLFLNYLLARHGVAPTEVSAMGIGVGATPIAAIERGRVDAASVSVNDLVALRMRHWDLIVLADSSTREGSKAIFGVDNYSTAHVLTTELWLTQNPETARRLVRSLKRTLAWIQRHPEEEIYNKLPDSHRSGAKAVDVEILRVMKQMYSPSGVIPPEAAEAAQRFLEAVSPKVRDGKFDLARAWANDFVTESK
jgi:NitT/TauT family transport system substrate-binding protein